MAWQPDIAAEGPSSLTGGGALGVPASWEQRVGTATAEVTPFSPGFPNINFALKSWNQTLCCLQTLRWDKMRLQVSGVGAEH